MPPRKNPGTATAQRTGSTVFASVVGHAHTIAALQGQRRLGRLAHAYCLIGEEGVGKTSVARALAEELLLGPGQPPRLEVHPDFWIDDRDEAISIDEIRFKPERVAEVHDQSLQQFLSLKPFVASARVAILANAERMTEAAQNCLLKTLEEPPPNTVLVLTTAYPDHLLATCLSRCQLLQLAPVPAGLVEPPVSPSRRRALAHWVSGVPAAHLRASLAGAQRTQLLIDENVSPRLAMEVLLLDLRVPLPA